MATGMVASDGHRYSRMVGCDRLGSFLNLSMAAGLVDREPFTCLYRCAKDHAPQGKVNLYSNPHCCVPPTNERESADSRRHQNLQVLLCGKCGSQMRTLVAVARPDLIRLD